MPNRKIYSVLLLLICLSLCAWNPFSFLEKKQKPQKETPPQETTTPATPAKDKTTVPREIDLEKKALQEKKEELDNTEWQIEISSSSQKNNNSEDVLRFTKGEMVSEEFEDMGYPPSRYTVRIRDGKGSWETMQRDENEKTIVFWRGDWENNQMKGMFSIQKEDGKIDSYSFQSTNKKNFTGNTE